MNSILNMKGKYPGVRTVDDFFRALPQDRLFFQSNNITHIRDACLFFFACDPQGRELVIYDEGGYPIEGYVSAGVYRSAAEQYEELRKAFEKPAPPLLPV